MRKNVKKKSLFWAGYRWNSGEEIKSWTTFPFNFPFFGIFRGLWEFFHIWIVSSSNNISLHGQSEWWRGERARPKPASWYVCAANCWADLRSKCLQCETQIKMCVTEIKSSNRDVVKNDISYSSEIAYCSGKKKISFHLEPKMHQISRQFSWRDWCRPGLGGTSIGRLPASSW